MNNLTESIARLDTENMLNLIKEFPEQWQHIMELTETVSIDVERSEIRAVCIAGMGGSAIGADIIKAYAAEHCPVPVHVLRHYSIPAWVNPHTLFIACSYSGNTEETLSAVGEAKKKNAQIIAVTSGGALQKEAEKWGCSCILIPGGMPPRAALANSFVPLFRIFSKLGFIPAENTALEETLALLKMQGSAFQKESGNLAMDVAGKLVNKLGIIYSDNGLLEPVNMRWRGQIEENSKNLIYGNFFPEMNHNEIVGWEKTGHLKDKVQVIFLVDKDDHPRIKYRQKVVQEILSKQSVDWIQLETTGSNRLARMFSLMQLADWVSFYLAMHNQVNPTTITNIDYLKAKLSRYL